MKITINLPPKQAKFFARHLKSEHPKYSKTLTLTKSPRRIK
jgi:hypothetical protein